MALQRLNEALYGAHCIHDMIKALTAPKRQPAGTGRRWPLRLRRVPGPEEANRWDKKEQFSRFRGTSLEGASFWQALPPSISVPSPDANWHTILRDRGALHHSQTCNP
jgi:hypothetical protein